MLTRLKVSGFKNLVDVDVRFGPFTCVAGINAVGKSNLFDAIRFLSSLADRTLIDAALSVRDEVGKTADLRSLFHCVGDDHDTEMSFEVEMIVPREGLDDLGQKATASTTFLRYGVTLAYRQDTELHSLGRLELIKEELAYIKKGDAAKQLLFTHKPSWRESAITGARFGSYFISTDYDGPDRIIMLHADKGGGDDSGGSEDGDSKKKKANRGGGKPARRLAASLPRTVLSATNAAENPTALLARKEMQSWRLLQLEPSALRQPDSFTAPTTLDSDGSHLAATLYHLAAANGRKTESPSRPPVYGQIAARLAELIEDVQEIRIERDERRQLLTLLITGRDGTSYPARALSDGTLRFLALATVELDPEAKGLICLEEPENGIHPERIPAMLRLLQGIATDVTLPLGDDNPLRQVIINTHSPSVVAQVPDDSLLVAESKETIRDNRRFMRVTFSPLPATWRQRGPEPIVPIPKGKLMAYLNPISDGDQDTDLEWRPVRRVMDRKDLQLLLPLAQRDSSKAVNE